MVPMVIEPTATESGYTYISCSSDPLLIKPAGTEPGCTTYIWHMAECRHTELLSLSLQSTQPPRLYTMDQQQPNGINHYTPLYKHLELLCNDSLHLCIYMTSSHILPPSVLLQQCITFKQLLADDSSVDTIEITLHGQIYSPSPFCLLLLNVVMILVYL